MTPPSDLTWLAWSPTNAVARGTELLEYQQLEGLTGRSAPEIELPPPTGRRPTSPDGARRGWLGRWARRTAPRGRSLY